MVDLQDTMLRVETAMNQICNSGTVSSPLLPPKLKLNDKLTPVKNEKQYANFLDALVPQIKNE